jgi:glycerate 2-kinase
MTEATSYDRLQRREHAESILRDAIPAADPAPLVRRALHGAVELADHGPVRIVAIGKAAPGMAAAAAEVLGDRLMDQLVVTPAGTPAPAGTLFGGHPAPDERSVAAGNAVIRTLHRASAGEMLLLLISGGASSCAAVPLGGITIHEYADCVLRLMRAGADIRELNIVRKHLDALKGGRMALHAAPASVLGLVLSDVVGDSLDVIASGPLTPDPTSCDDALHVLRRHGVLSECAGSIRRHLESQRERDGAADPACESPDAEHPAFAAVRVRIIGGNDVAVEGAAAEAARLGYAVRRAPDPVTGLAREAGRTLAREALLLQRAGDFPSCIVAGGETTVAASGDGRGGRNQEIVLAACIELDSASGITVASVGTDGVDGNSDAAGAMGDEASLEEAAAQQLDIRRIRERNDSYSFFAATDGVIATGPTGTNVNDVHIALIAAPAPVPRRE